MGIRRAFLLAVLLPLLASSAGALSKGQHGLSLYGGFALPGGAAGDTSKLGFSGGANVRHQFSQSFSAGLDGEFMRFGDQQIAGGGTSGADALSMGLILRFDAAGAERSHVPYLSVGPILSRVYRRTQSILVNETRTDWEPGVGVALGTMFGGDNFTFGPSARFRSFGRFGYAISGGLEVSFALASSAPK